MTTRHIRTWLTLLVLLVTAGTASARQYLQADLCLIEAGQRVEGVVFVLCQDLVINGVVDGNLIGAATTTTINGDVRDSVYLIGGQLDVFGTIGDDLHYLGAVLNIHSSAQFRSSAADVICLTMSTTIEPETDLSGTVLASGYQMLLDGQVAGEVNFWGSALELSGQLAGDLNAVVGDAEDTEGTAQLETLFLPLPVELELVDPGLRVSDTTTIAGDLNYSAPTRITTDSTLQAITAGDVNFTLISNQFEPPTDEESWRQSIQQYLATSVREFATLVVVGALGLLFAPRLTLAPIRNLRRRPLTSLGVGTLTFILSFPVFFFALIVSALIVFSLSLLQVGNLVLAGLVVLLILDVGGAGLFYFVAIFVARSVFCIAIGRRLLRFVFEDDGSTRYLYVSLIAGSVLIAFLVSLPVIGWIANALTLFLGLGAIVNLLQAYLRNLREGTASYVPGAVRTNGGPRGRAIHVETETPALPDATAAPHNDERPRQPRPRHTVGTDNLPPGFVWWDEL